MITSTVLGEKGRFCGAGCREAFRSDRKTGIIYPPVLIGALLVSWVEASRRLGRCAYCAAWPAPTA